MQFVFMLRNYVFIFIFFILLLEYVGFFLFDIYSLYNRVVLCSYKDWSSQPSKSQGIMEYVIVNDVNVVRFHLRFVACDYNKFYIINDALIELSRFPNNTHETQ